MLDNPWFLAILIVLGIIVVRLAIIYLVAGGDMRRIGIAFRAQRPILRDPTIADKVRALLEPREEKAPKPSGVPLRLLALLQREGRLLDFLLEDIQAYGDEQVGAAVRKAGWGRRA
jgi:hypothetical protein